MKFLIYFISIIVIILGAVTLTESVILVVEHGFNYRIIPAILASMLIIAGGCVLMKEGIRKK